MNTSSWLAATAMIGVGGFAVPAQANSLQTVPRQAPSMEEVVMTNGPQRNVTLNRLAEDIQHGMHPTESGVTTVDDVIEMPWLDSLLDENGELDLPLGLRVYSTLGDTSVGFGTQF